ncbi:hypothetical protein HIV01_004225 [Lysobacter arenosi]|uniref:Uncharacterized protein n=1 Tax=Lysobacter arenosi TaxID=2795387 RepID=A0ABX7RC61_9GAMM|nr:hypothetical protein [Lysobacter arenosi]QSX75738.1 hypothetical protein HIV01_004225 [Lysobacter arenosi]
MSEVDEQEPITSPQVRQLAVDAGKLVRSIGPLINHLKIPIDARNQTAVALFASSLDHGEALCALIATERSNSGGPALTLHRAQTEQFLRGSFFAEHATDDEIAYFTRKNQLKWRDGEKLTTAKIARIVESTFQGCGTSFSNSVQKTWSALCGYVHGGTEILDMYLTEDGNGINSALDVDRATKIISRGVSMAMMTTVVMSRLGNAKEPAFTGPFTEAYTECMRIAAFVKRVT